MEGYIFLPPEGHRATARQLARLSGYQTISFDNKKFCKLKSDAVVVNWLTRILHCELIPATPKEGYQQARSLQVISRAWNTSS